MDITEPWTFQPILATQRVDIVGDRNDFLFLFFEIICGDVEVLFFFFPAIQQHIPGHATFNESPSFSLMEIGSSCCTSDVAIRPQHLFYVVYILHLL